MLPPGYDVPTVAYDSTDHFMYTLICACASFLEFVRALIIHSSCVGSHTTAEFFVF